MSQVVTITSQGQLTIPRAIRRLFQMTGSTKADLRMEDGRIIVEPKTGFWSLAGSLKSKTRLTDDQLNAARATFETNWARND
ncbi:MAG: AbrB/MazE/SpoVT family DNA-binding domain-containing protein [Candidatus Uhrbacteria bacterium]